MIIITCFILLAISVWYVPARIKALLKLPLVWPWRLAALGIAAGYPFLLISSAYISENAVVAVIYNVSGLLFIFHVCLFLYLIIAHLFSRLLKNISGRAVLTTGLALSLAYVIFGFIQALSFTVTTFNLPVKGLSAAVKIAHIPDLHLGSQRGESYLRQVISAVNEHQPDIVIFNGDLVDSNIALHPGLFSLFKSLNGEKYFTTGNHEFYIDTPRALELIAGSGLRILRNEMTETHGFQLIGLEYMNADRVTYDSHAVNDLTIEEELPKINRDRARPTVLIHHSPVGLQYVSKGGIDLMLSGHTHGGQLFPGTVLAKLSYPLLKGLYDIDGTMFLVSQGAGTFGPWMRAGTFNEIQIITLKPPANE